MDCANYAYGESNDAEANGRMRQQMRQTVRLMRYLQTSRVSVDKDHVKRRKHNRDAGGEDAHGNAISGLSLSASLTGTALKGRPFPVTEKRTVPMLLR
ncbi:hypothetical protein ACLBOM_28555 [Escherichia coli]